MTNRKLQRMSIIKYIPLQQGLRPKKFYFVKSFIYY